MKKYDIILFDLDGTISESEEGITKCAQYALKHFGIEEKLSNLVKFIGPPLKESFVKYYGLNEDQAIKAVELYRERYEPIGIFETRMYPNMDILLKKLKDTGYTVGLATSKPQLMAEKILEYFGITEYFDCVVGADRNGPRQSKTDVLKEVFRQLNLTDKSKTVLIGDTIFDVQGASNLCIDAIGVSFGYGDVKEMIEGGAVRVVDSVDELIGLFEC